MKAKKEISMYPKLVFSIHQQVFNLVLTYCPDGTKLRSKYVNKLLLDVLTNYDAYAPRNKDFIRWLDKLSAEHQLIGVTLNESNSLLIKNYSNHTFRDFRNATKQLLYLTAFLMDTNKKINLHFKKLTDLK